jgi:hypothetical protein
MADACAVCWARFDAADPVRSTEELAMIYLLFLFVIFD